MATTDPGHGHPDPLGELARTPPGADASNGAGAPPAEVVARGHEADEYDAKSVISVPLLVILFFVLAFGVTTAMFWYFSTPPENPRANPQAVARNEAPLNERLARLGRGKEIDQPRLEPLKERAGYERAITSPEIPGVNSPELHPEDIFPSPTNTPALFKSGTVDAGKPGARTTITIDEAIKRSVQPNALPARKDPVALISSWHVATAANAGRGAGASEVVEPVPPVAPMPKPAEHKKPADEKGDKK
jgi:hypothetical protein